MTGTQFLLVFVSILLYMAALALAMIGALPLLNLLHASEGEQALALGIISLVGIIGMIPAMNAIMKRVVRFPGQGLPIALADLRTRLEALTDPQTPYAIEPTPSGYVLKPRYTDPHWRAQLQKSGTTTVTETRIRLDPKRHLATLTDIERSATWKLGADGIRLGWAGFRGVRMAIGINKTIDLRAAADGGQPTITERHASDAIKQPLMDLLRQAGWTTRYAMW